ncbi:hypothetical protein PG985_016025 [Apiospora marii]|uniref:Uncharacterized protein n=1 Tax=Apiospora marii TaxID=335849 RepID=A0ABR1S5Y8_9PEZI
MAFAVASGLLPVLAEDIGAAQLHLAAVLAAALGLESSVTICCLEGGRRGGPQRRGAVSRRSRPSTRSGSAREDAFWKWSLCPSYIQKRAGARSFLVQG